MDTFCGVGGNLSQFARSGVFCLGVDFDKTKVKMTQHNAEKVYDMKPGQDFHVIESDFLQLS